MSTKNTQVPRISKFPSLNTLLPAIFACGLMSATGCGSGPAGPKREAIVGTVTREGIELPSGNLTFVPTAGGPGATAHIENGKYKFDTKAGPIAGKQTVEIVYFPPRDFQPGVPKKEAPVIEDTRFKKPMPPKGWILTADVQPGQKEPIDFHIDE